MNVCRRAEKVQFSHQRGSCSGAAAFRGFTKACCTCQLGGGGQRCRAQPQQVQHVFFPRLSQESFPAATSYYTIPPNYKVTNPIRRAAIPCHITTPCRLPQQFIFCRKTTAAYPNQSFTKSCPPQLTQNHHFPLKASSRLRHGIFSHRKLPVGYGTKSFPTEEPLQVTAAFPAVLKASCRLR